MKRALVTGHLGLVGSHFASRLESDGWEVDGCDIREPVRADCRDLFRYDDTRYDLAVHAAAVVGGRATIEGEPMDVATDLAIDSDYFQWCMRTRPRRALYFSSSAAYPVDLQGEGSTHRLAECDIDLGDPRLADAVYGWAKLTGEMQAELVRAEGVPVTVLRPMSGYGEDQALDYPFPSFIERAARREDPFTIWGDGQQVRDWVHIDDIIDAVMVMVEQGIDGPVNLCNGRATSFDDLARLVCESAGYRPEIRHLTDAPSGVRYRVGDPTLMRTFYEPTVSLEAGVDRALRARLDA